MALCLVAFRQEGGSGLCRLHIQVSEDEDHARLDVWLWRARFFKTRPLATDFVTRKGVRLARGGLPVRKIGKAGHSLTLGDVLAFSIVGQPFHLQVLDFGTRRGPPAEAQLLYHMLLDTP